jgi:hypothetical protein
MYSEGAFLNSDSEDELARAMEMSLREVSISSIKTQDSIENNSIRIEIDPEEHKESDRIQFGEVRETPIQFIPFLSFKEAQQVISNTLNSPRRRLEIKPLHEIRDKIHKISEDFQIWRKQD